MGIVKSVIRGELGSVMWVDGRGLERDLCLLTITAVEKERYFI